MNVFKKNLAILFFLFLPFQLQALDDPLINIQEVIPDVVIDVRYATPNNFLKKPVYPIGVVFLKQSVAQKLKIASDDLRKKGFRLKIFDGYRPLSVQKQMWEIMPDSRYVANPKNGSIHNRGGAIDLTLVNLDGSDVAMPSEYDEFNAKAHHNNKLSPPETIANANILKQAMENAGLQSIATEWWHYQDPDSKKFPVLDIPLEELLKK